MSCTLTSGRTEPCRDAIGGLKAIYLANFLEDGFTVDASEAIAINAALTEVFKYELIADGNTYVETPTQDPNAGTTTYEQVLSVVLKKQTKESANELAIVLRSRCLVVVQYRDGSYRVMGIEDGTYQTGDFQSGGAKNEFNGYNLTFNAMETAPAPYLDDATITALDGIVSATNVTP
jgi:hypothetical protein